MKSNIKRGSDLQLDFEISLDEAATNPNKKLTYERAVVCTTCAGKGDLFGEACEIYDGTGHTNYLQTIELKIPAGVENGSKLRFHGYGNEGHEGWFGDLYLLINIRPHDQFERKGADLFTTMQVTLAELKRGMLIDVPTLLDGLKQVKVPAGTKPDSTLRLNNFGMPLIGSQNRGDLYIRLEEAAEAIYSPRLRVFLCHSSNDKPAVRSLYFRLRNAEVAPWLDEEDLLPGQKWEKEIPKAVRNSDVVIVCLSKDSINKKGYLQKEIRYALDVADEQPEGEIFLIPLRLEECEVPEHLRSWHWVNLYEESGYERLLRALHARATKLGLTIKESY
ncbi:MAG: DnaJ C-terminal domain-containing protein [Chitinophagaceae bacterium]